MSNDHNGSAAFQHEMLQVADMVEAGMTTTDSTGSVQSTSPSTSTNAITIEDKSCHLLALPDDLRDMIWRLALVEDEPIEISMPCGRHKFPPGDPPLTQTCRQIQHEALVFYYSENTFIQKVHVRYDSWEIVRHWILWLGQERCDLLRRVDVMLHVIEPWSRAQLDWIYTIRYLIADIEHGLLEEEGMGEEGMEVPRLPEGAFGFVKGKGISDEMWLECIENAESQNEES